MINTKYNLKIKETIIKTEKNNSKKKNNDCNQNSKKLISMALLGLSTVGIATLIIKSKKVPKQAIKETANDITATFKKGLAYGKDGQLFTGEITKVNSLDDKFHISIKNGIIQQSTKYSPNGKISWVKKYSKDKNQNKIVDILTPNTDDALVLKNRLVSSKDKFVKYSGENIVEQCWYNTPSGFKRIDQFIDKSDIKTHMRPIKYYQYNGIQINSFLRDGKFSNPDISMDCIPYDLLDNPNCSEYAKDEVRDIMRDNRFILSAIDDLDVLTKSSKTIEPMTVYRNAPYWWVEKAKDGILEERAFCSTSSVKGASMEGLCFGKYHKDGITYKINLPQGTPFLDLRDSNEKEVLLPRNSKFKVIDNSTLEYILE